MYIDNVEVPISLERMKGTGSNRFSIICEALALYTTHTIKAAMEKDDEVKNDFLADAVGAGELLSELLRVGFYSVFDSSFYPPKEKQSDEEQPDDDE